MAPITRYKEIKELYKETYGDDLFVGPDAVTEICNWCTVGVKHNGDAVKNGDAHDVVNARTVDVLATILHGRETAGLKRDATARTRHF
jgi:hypothetical protein